MKEGWEYKKLGEICFIERGGSPRPIKQYITNRADGLNWIKIGDAVEGSKYIKSTKEKIIPEGLKKTRFVHKGDFILSNSMSFGKPYILGIDGCIHDGWLVIRDNNKIFDKTFLYYLLSSPNMYQEFKRLAVGGVVNNLNSNLVRNVVVPIPPLAEQERIVAELDLLSSIIDKKKAQLKELDQLAQSIFYDMFGDPITNEKGWEVKKLGEVCLLKAGKAIRAAELKEKADNTFPCYGGNGIRGYINKVSHKNDLPIIGRQGALCGNVNYAKAPFYATEHAVVVTPLIEMNIKWLYNELKLLQLEQYAHGVAQPGIAVSDLSPISFPIPPLPLQQEFASKIEAIERQKSLIQQSIVETQTLFDSRMEHWFN